MTAQRGDELMIARRAKHGYANEAESRVLLAELRAVHSPGTLPAALVYHGFVSVRDAERLRG